MDILISLNETREYVKHSFLEPHTQLAKVTWYQQAVPNGLNLTSGTKCFPKQRIICDQLCVFHELLTVFEVRTVTDREKKKDP